MPSFRLDERPWIPVVDREGRTRERSLLETIEGAAELWRIGGNPLEAATLTRLLVAIAHLVRHPEGARDWGRRVWGDREGLLRDMAAYVRARPEVWDLYDPVRPFAQDPRITEANGTPAALVYERARGNNPVFADHSRVSDPRPLPSAQAARALLVTHAYRASGTGGNNPINGGKKDQMHAGPLYSRSVCFLEGANLAETIALNVVNLNGETRVGTPVWDRAPVAEPGKIRADGVVDLLTRATRAVRLCSSVNGDRCVGVAIYMAQAVQADEPGAVRDPNIPRERTKTGHRPLSLDTARDLWRISPVLLAARAGEAGHEPAPVVQQLGAVAGLSVPRDARIGLRFLGLAAEPGKDATEAWRDETLPFSLSVVADDAAYARLAEAVATAEEEGRRLRGRLKRFAERYLAAGTSKADPSAVDRLVEELAPGMDAYWREVAPAGQRLGENPPDPEAWRADLRRIASRAFDQAVGRLPVDARRLRAQFAGGAAPRVREVV